MKKMLLSIMFVVILFAVATSQPQNVVFIICDDLNDKINGFGVHRQAYILNIDRLAKMGGRFANAESNALICALSCPSLLSGLYPTGTGMLSGNPAFRTMLKLDDAELFPTYFKNNFYRCSVFFLAITRHC